MARSTSSGWTGWIVFAGVMMIVVGSINVMQGIFALIWDDRVAVTRNNLYVVDLTGWGWTVLLSGVVLFLVGLGLLGGQTWARVTGIIIVGLHALTQVMWLGAYPVWGMLMLALDTIVLFALTARWSAAAPELDTSDDWSSSQHRSAPVA